MTKSKHTRYASVPPTGHGRLRVGIKAKIILSIVLVSVTIITVIWALEVAFLDYFHNKAKQDRLISITEEVTSSLNQYDYEGAAELLERLAWENSVCISINNSSGMEQMFAEGLGDNCYVHMNIRNRRDLMLDAVRHPGEYRININSPHPQFDAQYMSCSVTGITETSTKTPYIVVATASLAPIKDVTAVILQQITYIAPLLLVAATAFAFLIARSLAKPLEKISKAARRIAEGSLNVSVDVESNDEIGDLARDFNTMSREISKVNTLQRELVANISHDIRTPLTMIKGYAEMIKDITGDDREAREQQLDIIVDEANRLSTLVSDVMDLSLMQAGQTAFHPADFDITAKVRDILGRYRLLEQTRGFEFHLEADRPYLVHADEVRIEQVLYNLINNAVNHIGEVKRITVRIFEDLGEAKVEVIDTGTGIRQEDLPLIWDRYFKPYKKGEKQSMGTGLGLSIVKAILMNHQSRFGVNSTLGVGSTFWFTLTLAERGENAPALPAGEEEPPSPQSI